MPVGIPSLFRTPKRAAHLAVARARRSGDLLPPSTYYCTDCGASAEHYDHRDYVKTLDIEPVCRTCNYRRGPAKNKRID